MWQSFVGTLKEFTDQWGSLSFGKKAGVISVFTIVVGCMIALGVWIGEKSYAPLYTNLQPEESIALVKILQEENIPYLVSNDGTTISIPPELVQPTLMKLAVKGTPGGQKPGMELFDKQTFGTSSYVQRINYVRALQGELSRTINTLRAVKKAAVHISMPPKTSFLEVSEDPKASVVVEIHPGRSLAKEEVKGVQFLVASSVEGLRPERVTVVDSTGVALTSVSDGISALSSNMLEHQKKIESELERRVEDMVGRMVGVGNVVARVNAELDFDPLQEQEVIYDPEQSAVKSEVKQENNMEGTRPVAQGAAGAEAALPGPANATPEARQQVAKSNKDTNYEVSEKRRSREKALGAVKRLSVAVLVNDENVKGDDGKVTTRPISPERKAVIEKLVKDAVGFTVGRDSVSIESSAFAMEDLDKADELIARTERRKLIFSLINYGTIALIVFLFFIIVVRPFVRWVTGISTAKVETVLPKTVEELEAIQEPSTAAIPGMAHLPLLDEAVDLEKAEGELLKEKIVSLVNIAPGKAAQVISEWLALDAGNEKGKKSEGKKR